MNHKVGVSRVRWGIPNLAATSWVLTPFVVGQCVRVSSGQGQQSLSGPNSSRFGCVECRGLYTHRACEGKIAPVLDHTDQSVQDSSGRLNSAGGWPGVRRVGPVDLL